MSRSIRILSIALLLVACAAGQYKRPDNAVRANPVLDGAATLWLDPTLWTRVLSSRDDTMIFIHVDSLAHGRLIFIREGKPAKEQAAEVLERVKKVSPTAKIIFEEPRTVNGTDVYCFQIEARRDNATPMIYYGYLYGDEELTIQAIGLVEQPNLGRYYIDITSFLNGLEIGKPSAP